MEKRLTDVLDQYREKFIALHELLLQKAELEYADNPEEAEKVKEGIHKQIAAIKNISYEDMIYFEIRSRICMVEIDSEDIKDEIEELKEKTGI